MCCQDGNEAIWQMLYEPAGWPTRAEHGLAPHEQPCVAELPTPAAELTIKLVAIQDGELTAIQDAGAVSGIEPHGQARDWWLAREPVRWPAEAADSFSLQEQPGVAELPTPAAELTIKLVSRTGKP